MLRLRSVPALGAQAAQLRLAFPFNPLSLAGEYSYLGTTLRRGSIEPMPSLLDVRQLVTLYGILPLGKSHMPPAGLTVSSCCRQRARGSPLPPEF